MIFQTFSSSHRPPSTLLFFGFSFLIILKLHVTSLICLRCCKCVFNVAKECATMREAQVRGPVRLLSVMSTRCLNFPLSSSSRSSSRGIFEIELSRRRGQGLGLRLIGGNDTPLGNIAILEIFENGAVAADDQLQLGDQILQVSMIREVRDGSSSRHAQKSRISQLSDCPHSPLFSKIFKINERLTSQLVIAH